MLKKYKVRFVGRYRGAAVPYLRSFNFMLRAHDRGDVFARLDKIYEHISPSSVFVDDMDAKEAPCQCGPCQIMRESVRHMQGTLFMLLVVALAALAAFLGCVYLNGVFK